MEFSSKKIDFFTLKLCSGNHFHIADYYSAVRICVMLFPVCKMRSRVLHYHYHERFDVSNLVLCIFRSIIFSKTKPHERFA